MPPLKDNIEQAVQAVDSLAFIAGGAARWYYQHMHNLDPIIPGDIDIFMETNDPVARDVVVARLAFLGYMANGRQGSSTSFTHQTSTDDADPLLPIQLIDAVETEYTLTFGSPAEVLANFSFTVECFAAKWDIDHVRSVINGATVGTETILRHLADRQLVINHITCPVGIAWRANKYGRKGFTISLRAMAEIFAEWERRPDEYRHEVVAGLNSGDGTTSTADWYSLLSID